MDKEAALIIAAKDLFLEAWKRDKVFIETQNPKTKELEQVAEKFLILYNKLTTGIKT